MIRTIEAPLFSPIAGATTHSFIFPLPVPDTWNANQIYFLAEINQQCSENNGSKLIKKGGCVEEQTFSNTKNAYTLFSVFPTTQALPLIGFL